MRFLMFGIEIARAIAVDAGIVVEMADLRA
jgi:hypothetical protein